MQSIAARAPRIDRTPLHEQAVALLRDMILRTELRPGERLNERLLCERLGISRTPLREALKTLAAEGLVQLLPNRGAVVAQLDIKELGELFAVIGALEGLAGELACMHATESEIAEIAALHYEMRLHFTRSDLAEYFRCNQAIHEKMVAAAHNSELSDTYRRLSGRLRRARFAANLSRERWSEAMREHDEMLECLQQHDAARIGPLLRRHLDKKLEAVRPSLIAAATSAAG